MFPCFDVDDDADNRLPSSRRAAVSQSRLQLQKLWSSLASRFTIPIRWVNNVRKISRSLVSGVPGGSRYKYAGAVDHGGDK